MWPSYRRSTPEPSAEGCPRVRYPSESWQISHGRGVLFESDQYDSSYVGRFDSLFRFYQWAKPNLCAVSYVLFFYRTTNTHLLSLACKDKKEQGSPHHAYAIGDVTISYFNLQGDFRSLSLCTDLNESSRWKFKTWHTFLGSVLLGKRWQLYKRR